MDQMQFIKRATLYAAGCLIALVVWFIASLIWNTFGSVFALAFIVVLIVMMQSGGAEMLRYLKNKVRAQKTER